MYLLIEEMVRERIRGLQQEAEAERRAAQAARAGRANPGGRMPVGAARRAAGHALISLGARLAREGAPTAAWGRTAGRGAMGGRPAV